MCTTIFCSLADPLTATQNADDYSSDNLDDTDTEKAPPKKKAKLSKAAEAKLKAKAKAKAKGKKKKGEDDEDYNESDSGEDAYTALSKMWKDPNKPPVGSFAECAKCGTEFTVVWSSLHITVWIVRANLIPDQVHGRSCDGRFFVPPVREVFRGRPVQKTCSTEKAQASHGETYCTTLRGASPSKSRVDVRQGDQYAHR